MELKGSLGSAGKARIQNLTACYVGHRIIFHLASLARNADPETYRPPTDVMHKVYGLQTGSGGAVWKLVVMTASKREGKLSRSGEQAWNLELDASVPAEDALTSPTDKEDELDIASWVSFVGCQPAYALERTSVDK